MQNNIWKLEDVYIGFAVISVISIYYFAPDTRKQGGHYNKTTGCVKKIDVINEKLMMIDGNEIAFKHIKEIQGDFFLSIMESENIT